MPAGRVRVLAVVVLGCAAAAAVAASRWADRDVRVTPLRLGRSPGVVVRPAGVAAPGAAALLVHGFGCNGSMMMPLAKHLARRGISAYVLDLPGHGASALRFDPGTALAEVGAALAEAAARERLRAEEVVLVGHSYGAALLAQVAPRAAAAAFLAPSYAGGLSAGAPRALLVVTAEHDHPWILEAVERMRRDVERAPDPGAERDWRVAPAVGHVGIVRDAAVHGETARFVERARGPRRPADAGGGPPPWLPDAAAAVALAASLGVALAGAAWLRAWIGPARPAPELAPLRSALVLAYACVAAVAACSAWGAAEPIRLLEGGGLASLLVAAGLAACLLDAALCRGAHLPRRRDLSGVPVGLLPFGALYVAAALTVDGRLYATALGEDHLALAGSLFLGLLPLFTVTEAILAACRGRVSRLAGPLGVLALYGVLALAAPFVFRAPLLLRLVPLSIAIGAASIAAGAAVRAVTRMPAASATFSAACLAWLFAVGFARS